ncbi:MAG: hypothetical protein R3D33_03590 [Hyphomicrobiaceae bacterium]
MTNAHAIAAQRLLRPFALMLAVALAGLGLAGCETGQSIIGQGDPGAGMLAQPAKSKLAFVPIIGAPATVANQMTASLVAAVERQAIPVARAPGEAADYKVLGYVVAAPEKAGTKVSYIWDVTDAAGARVTRFTGEEYLPGKAAKDPWSVIDQQVIERIAMQSAMQIAAWVPPAPGSASAAVAQTGGTPTSAAGLSGTPLSASGTGGLSAQSASLSRTPGTAGDLVSGQVVGGSGARTAALPAGRLATIVPSVAGAPGDGSSALAKALQRQLAASGVSLTDKAGPTAYLVQGKVQMGSAKGGKQSIKIEWQVLDPAGKRIGTVSQSNEVPQGSLDGAWGRTADAAAGEAAKGILKLLPKETRVN